MAVVASGCWSMVEGVASWDAIVLLRKCFGENFNHACFGVLGVIGIVRFLNIVLALATPVTIHEGDSIIDVIGLSGDNYTIKGVWEHLFEQTDLFTVIIDASDLKEGVDFALEVLRVLIEGVLLVSELIEGSEAKLVVADEIGFEERFELCEVVAISSVSLFFNPNFGSEESSCEGEGLFSIQSVEGSE